ncbi:MAG: SMP-30/gluconolactonase/LRE family protein [Actinomycetota bacterium]|nr:SMP-30/gluconolactonase/LRE family protein [Actinomycetota bacterium]
METLTEGYGLIEGPVWDDGRGLLFSDVVYGGVFAVTRSGDVSKVFDHRKGIGGMALHVEGGWIVSGRNIAYKPDDGGPSISLLEKDESAGLVGFNDITTDAKGRVYAGGLGGDPLATDQEPTSGDLFLIDVDGSSRVVGHDIRLTNGLGFSPDGRTLYHSDSIRRTVMRYAVHDNGSLGNKTPFVSTDGGAPDGLVVSEDGAVWVALASDGHGVAVYESDGTFRELIEIPVPMCTSVCFGGDDLRDLYIVSGSDGTNSERGGGVYVTRSEVPGVGVTRARVRIPLVADK